MYSLVMANNRYQYTVPTEEGLCAMYAGDWDDAYAVVRELHAVNPSYLRVIGESENDWACPLSPCGPSGDVKVEIERNGFIRWDGTDNAWQASIA